MNIRPDADTTVQVYFNDIVGSIPLSREREVELAARVRAGDIEARNELVEANLRYVISVAKKYQHCGLPLDELISAGNAGLMEAAGRFDGTRGFKFISYAVWWIRQAILKAIAEDCRTVRNPMNIVQLLSRISKSSRRLRGAGVLNPGIKDIADELDIPEDEVAHAIALNQSSISLDDPYNPLDDSSMGLLDRLPDESIEPPDEGLNQQDQCQQIQAALQCLPEREAEVLRLYYGLNGREPMTLEQIGGRLGLTRERIRQLKEAALQRLRRSPRADFLALLIGNNVSALSASAAALQGKYIRAHRKKVAASGKGCASSGTRRTHRRTSVRQ